MEIGKIAFLETYTSEDGGGIGLMPELRKDLITERWVIIATERAKRPHDFTQPPSELEVTVCPFCPGNESQTPPELWAARATGGPNQPGWQVRVIPNKFPALRIEGEMNREADGIYDRMNGIGAHEVIIDTPEHTQTVEEQTVANIALALTACKERMLDLQRDVRFRYILAFKNVGREAGASLRHSHYQLIATPVTPLRQARPKLSLMITPMSTPRAAAISARKRCADASGFSGSNNATGPGAAGSTFDSRRSGARARRSRTRTRRMRSSS